MDYFWFLFRFEGRINCAKYWLATLSILCGMISVLLLLAILIIILGIGGPLAINLVVISASIRFTGEASLFPQIVIIPMTVFFAWRFAAASIKRLHDRNKSAWWLVPFFSRSSLRRACSTSSRTGWRTLFWRVWPAPSLSVWASGALSNCSA